MRRLAAQLARELVINASVTFQSEKPSQSPQMKVLLAYVVLPLIPGLRRLPTVRFSNWGLARTVVAALRQLGTSVQVVDARSRLQLSPAAFNGLILHGGHCSRMAQSRDVGSRRVIFFGTGNYWRFANEQIQERAEYLLRRRGKRLEGSRWSSSLEEEVIRAADWVVNLGNDFVASKFPPDVEVRLFRNGVFPPAHLLQQKPIRVNGLRRRGFLFFSGPGSLAKGLDLVLEAFAGRTEELHICHSVDEDVATLYRSVLNQGNVFVHGVIPMRGRLFRSLIERCGWVLAPSATDAQPGALLECMAHGMVPIATRTVGVDLGPHGVTLEPPLVEVLQEAVDNAILVNPADLYHRCSATVHHTLRHHTPELVLEDLITAFDGLLE